MRHKLTIRNTLLLTIGGLTLLITLLVAHKTYASWQRLQDTKALRELTLLNTQLFQSISKLSEERGYAYVMLHSSDADFITARMEDMQTARKEADALLASIREAGSGRAAVEDRRGEMGERIRAVAGLRQRVDTALTHPALSANRQLAQEWFAGTTALVESLQDMNLELYERFSTADRTWTRHLRFNHLLSVINEYAGRERSLNGGLIVAGLAPTPEEQVQRWRWQGMIGLSWKIAGSLITGHGFDNKLKPYFDEAESHYYSSFDMMHGIIQPSPSEDGSASYLINGTLWLQLAAEALGSLSELHDVSLANTMRFVEQNEQRARKEILLHFLLLLFALGLCAYSFHVITSRVLRPVHNMAEALYAVMKGKPVPSGLMAVQREDEIGKLASVLTDYQANSEKIKRTSAELARHVHALERSNKELDDFAYIASHDLKEPLRGIHNHSRFLLEDNEGKLDQESIDRLHRLTYLSQRMEKLINDLLYFSRLGRQDMAIRPTDLNEVIRDIEATLEHFVQEHNGSIVVPEPLPVLTCDQTRITEVYRNLITNGLKYNESEKKIIELGCLAEYANPDGVVFKNVLYVKDNGVGIAPEFSTEVFRIFRRLHATKGKEGTGVGLTFVKKIIERHGGVIWLESQPGKGTTFYFALEGI